MQASLGLPIQPAAAHMCRFLLRLPCGTANIFTEIQCRFILLLTFGQQCVPHTFAAEECVPAGPAFLQLSPALAALPKAHFAALGTASSALSSDSVT